jgi:orotidine-5'-phosphate decarboxylase
MFCFFICVICAICGSSRDCRAMIHFADRLAEAVRAKRTPLCVGIDPRWESLPITIRRQYGDGTLAGVARAYEAFGLRVLELVSSLVPVVKPQSAFFEACGPDGMRAMQTILRSARERGLLTILDGKRNDISSTATAYADAAFDGTFVDGKRLSVWDADALTVNPYLGQDAVEPFLQAARRTGRGLFVLLRTSNAGAGRFQDLDCHGKPLYRHVAEAISDWGRSNRGVCGFGDLGAVVGATHARELAELRRLIHDVWFLVPGFGAQGASAADVAPAFRPDGLGAIVNSSRGITFPFSAEDPQWEQAIVKAAREAIAKLAAAVPAS